MTSYNTDHKVVIGGRISLLTKHGQELSYRTESTYSRGP